MKALDVESLPKRVRIAQGTIATSLGHANVTRTGAIMLTIYNYLCTLLIGISHNDLVEG